MAESTDLKENFLKIKARVAAKNTTMQNEKKLFEKEDFN